MDSGNRGRKREKEGERKDEREGEKREICDYISERLADSKSD